MMPEQIQKFREIVTLADGARILIRPMVKEDQGGLTDLFSSVTNDDLRYFRHDVKDPKVINKWIDDLDYYQVIPLLATANDHVVGNATLHFGKGPRRHIGEIRLYLKRDFRKRGLGMKILRVIIDMARRQGLHILVAEVIAENVKVAKAFENLGFVQKCILDDFFMFPDGECIDVKIMMMPLKLRIDEF